MSKKVAKVAGEPPVQSARPFLKWAGGKTQLLPALRARVPAAWDPQRDPYCEPFVGAGALYFALRPRKARLGDLCADLMNGWQVVRDHLDELVDVLRSLQARYRLGALETFLEVRGWDPGALDEVWRAARLIFLNKTCFNGIYRVNQQGVFNVGWGKVPRVTIADADNLARCSELMRAGEVELSCEGFDAGPMPAPGTLVYLDPPYIPETTSGFVRYNSVKFERADHERLVAYAVYLVEGGCHVIASQSGDEKIVELYGQHGFDCRRVDAVRKINSKGTGRGAVGEYIISRSPVARVAKKQRQLSLLS